MNDTAIILLCYWTVSSSITSHYKHSLPYKITLNSKIDASSSVWIMWCNVHMVFCFRCSEKPQKSGVFDTYWCKIYTINCFSSFSFYTSLEKSCVYYNVKRKHCAMIRVCCDFTKQTMFLLCETLKVCIVNIRQKNFCWKSFRLKIIFQ